MRGLRFLFAVLLVGWVVLLAGCGKPAGRLLDDGSEGGAAGSSTTASTGEGGTGGDIFATTSSTGGEGGGPACAGVCKEAEPVFYDRLSMWWLGPSEEAPPCPDVAPLMGSEGFADPIAPFTCPSCDCAPAACALPDDIHVAAATCPGDGAPSIAWGSPVWSGDCTAEGAIPPGQMCGGVPCAQSLKIGAARVEPCQIVEEGAEAIAEPAWGLMARECKIGPLTGEGCITTGEACVPAPPLGFTLCVHRSGDDPTVPCPTPSYPYRYVVYAGVQDDRSCAPCSCGDPQGGACSAYVQAYADGACGVPIAAATVALGDPQCVDLPAGVGLGSKAATWMEQTPGSCTPQGGPVGAIVLSSPETLCCETELYKPPE